MTGRPPTSWARVMRRAAAAALAAVLVIAAIAPVLVPRPAPSGLHGPDLRGVTYVPSPGSTPGRGR